MIYSYNVCNTVLKTKLREQYDPVAQHLILMVLTGRLLLAYSKTSSRFLTEDGNEKQYF